MFIKAGTDVQELEKQLCLSIKEEIKTPHTVKSTLIKAHEQV